MHQAEPTIPIADVWPLPKLTKPIQAAYNALSPGAQAYVPQEILDRLNQLIADLQNGGGGGGDDPDPGNGDGGDGGNGIDSPRFIDPVLILTLKLPHSFINLQ